MAAHAEADIEVLAQRNPRRASREAELTVVSSEPHDEVIAMLFNFQTLRRPQRRLHFARDAAFLIAELQRRHSIAVHGDIDVRRIGIERRTGHKQSLAMRVHAFAKELNVSLEKTVTRDSYPDKVEIVFVKPDVFSTGGDGIGFLRGIVNDLAGVEEDADITFVFEDAEIAG